MHGDRCWISSSARVFKLKKVIRFPTRPLAEDDDLLLLFDLKRVKWLTSIVLLSFVWSMCNLLCILRVVCE
jgi:hypothetical protein